MCLNRRQHFSKVDLDRSRNLDLSYDRSRLLKAPSLEITIIFCCCLTGQKIPGVKFESEVGNIALVACQLAKAVDAQTLDLLFPLQVRHHYYVKVRLG